MNFDELRDHDGLRPAGTAAQGAANGRPVRSRPFDQPRLPSHGRRDGEGRQTSTALKLPLNRTQLH